MRPAFLLSALLCLLPTQPTARSAEPPLVPGLTRPAPITMAELAKRTTDGVAVAEVSDYVFGNYRGGFVSPPSADLNPKKAFIISWKDFAFRFVFSHEASYCPWFELSDGSGVCFQFFEGNDGWAELFNQWGRQERNSFVDIIEAGPKRAWVRWTYCGVNVATGRPAYRATEDFWAYPNGLVLRRQTYRTLMPHDHHGYAREPIELIGLCPVGKRWRDVLKNDPASGECHALSVVDAFSPKRYDVYWTPKPGTLWESTHRRSGCAWKDLDGAAGIALAIPMNRGTPFCVFGDASGYHHRYTRIKDHTFTDDGSEKPSWQPGSEIWGSQCWDHWPIGWLNSQGHVVDEKSLQTYPNHFAPAGMDFFALRNEVEERGVYYSLYGVGGDNIEAIRTVARQWLAKGTAGITATDIISDLSTPGPRTAK
jgi:hypothetical protein